MSIVGTINYERFKWNDVEVDVLEYRTVKEI